VCVSNTEEHTKLVGFWWRIKEIKVRERESEKGGGRLQDLGGDGRITGLESLV